MQLLGTSIIGYSRGKKTSATMRAENPTTGSTIDPEFFEIDLHELNHAIELADRASDAFAAVSPTDRAKFLKQIASNLESAKEALVSRGQLETALPEARLQAELGRTCGQLRLFASYLEAGDWVDARVDHADPDRKPIPKPDVRSLMMPIGPVAVFAASNFPLAFSVAGGDTASALAAGCPVIVKAHRAHMGVSEIAGTCVAEAAKQTGMPEGTFSVIFGAGTSVGSALVKHQSIKGVGFTGSRGGGRQLMDLAAARHEPIPVYAEMGSINPVVMLPGALAKRGSELATGLHGSLTLGVGQFCTNPGLIFTLASPETESFITTLGEHVSKTPVGTMLSSGICKAYRIGVATLASIPGVQTVAQPAATSTPGAQVSASLFRTDALSFIKHEELSVEVFGPSSLVVVCASMQELLRCLDVLEGQLTGCIFAEQSDADHVQKVLPALSKRVGRVIYNGFPTGVEVCHSMHHGGPYPATSDGRSTSVGTRAINRWVRPICLQGLPDQFLPTGLQEANPANLMRLVDGKLTR